PADEWTEDHLDRAGNVEDILGKQVVVEKCVEHAGKGRDGGGDHHGVHFVAERIDAGGACRLLVFADGEQKVADAAAEQDAAENEDQHGRGENDVIEHRRIAAQPPQIVVRVLRNGQEQARGGVDDFQVG